MKNVFFLKMATYKVISCYAAKFKIGGFIISSFGLTLYGVDLNFTVFIPLTQTISDIYLNIHSLPSLFIDTSLYTHTPVTLPEHNLSRLINPTP